MLRRSSPSGLGKLENGETEPLLQQSNRSQTQSSARSLFASGSINSTLLTVDLGEEGLDGTSDRVGPSDGTSPPQSLVIYGSRWWILLVFSLMSFGQNVIWNTWSPLDKSVALAFNWTTADVALQTNWGCITFVVFAPIFSWLMDVKGLQLYYIGLLYLLLPSFNKPVTNGIPLSYTV